MESDFFLKNQLDLFPEKEIQVDFTSTEYGYLINTTRDKRPYFFSFWTKGKVPRDLEPHTEPTRWSRYIITKA